MTSPDRRSAPKPTRMENCSFWAAQLPAGHSRPLWHRLAAGEGSGFATVRVSALSRQRGIQMTGVTRYLCCCDGRCYWVACVLRSTAKAKSGALGFCLGAQLSSYLPAFVKGMRDLGYMEGKNLIVEWRFADGKFRRLPDLAAQLRAVEGGRHCHGRVARDWGSTEGDHTIPIVMATTGDPVGSGFVRSLARPGKYHRTLRKYEWRVGPKLLDDVLHSVDCRSCLWSRCW